MEATADLKEFLEAARTTLMKTPPEKFYSAAEELETHLRTVKDGCAGLNLEKVDEEKTNNVVQAMYSKFAEGLLLTIPKVGDLQKRNRKMKCNGILKKVDKKIDVAKLCPGVVQLIDDLKSMNDLSTDCE